MKEQQEVIKIGLENPLTFHKPSNEKSELEAGLILAGVQITDRYIPRSTKKSSKKLGKRKASAISRAELEQLQIQAPLPLPEEEVSSSDEEVKKQELESYKPIRSTSAEQIVLLDSESDQEKEGRKQSPPQDSRGNETTGISNLSRIEDAKDMKQGSATTFLHAVLSEQPTHLPRKLQFQYRNQRAQISSHEMLKLLPQQYLNDNIIMSFIYLLMRHLTGTDIADRTYIFDNYFIDKLANEAADPTQVFLQARKYSKRCPDLFQKDFWIIPACRLHHWIAYIVAYPGLAFNFQEEEQSTKRPCIMALDSLPAKLDHGMPLSSQYKLSKDIRMFMEMEYKFRKCQINGKSSAEDIIESFQVSEVHLSELDVPFNPVRVPRQTNSSDCGIYLLQYIQLFLYEPSFLFEQDEGSGNYHWFNQDLIENKRQQIAVLFYEFAHDRDPIPDYTAYREELYEHYYKQLMSQDHSYREGDLLLDEELILSLDDQQSCKQKGSVQNIGTPSQSSSISLYLVEQRANGHCAATRPSF